MKASNSKHAVRKAYNSLVLTQAIANENKSSLNNVVVLHINHALPDVFAFNQILVKYLKAKVFFITTPYNQYTHSISDYDYLFIKRGVRQSKFYLNGNKISTIQSHTNFIANIHESILFALDHIHKNYPDRKLIVLQDGGYTAVKSEILDQKSEILNKYGNLIGLVEQTQGGTRVLAERDNVRKLNYPILTISRSLIKTRMENHFISQRIVEETNRYLYKIGEFISFKTIIVGGYGIIGRQVSLFLRNTNSEVIVYDTDPKVLRLASKEGFTTTKHLSSRLIDRSFCYIGCTGQQSFDIEAFLSFIECKSRKYFLVSGSSKRYEFEAIIDFFSSHNRNKIIDKYQILKDIKDIKTTTVMHGAIEFKFTYNSIQKKIILVGEGFPINFYFLDSESVPDKAIDPIHTLLLLSLIQVNKQEHLKTGINHICDKEVVKITKIDEEDLLKKWFYLNSIYSSSSKPFEIFQPHPLEKYLRKKY